MSMVTARCSARCSTSSRPIGSGAASDDVALGAAVGADEWLLSVDHMDNYRALLPAAEVRTEPGWGYFPMIEQPQAFSAEVAALARAIVHRGRSPR